MIVLAALLAFISLIIAPDKLNATSAISQLINPASGAAVWHSKLPRMLAAVMAGIILAISGSVFQGILGNRRAPTVYMVWLIISSIISLIAAFFFMIIYVKVNPSMLQWFIGSLSTANWYKVSFELPILLLALIVALFYYKDLNALLLGEDVASTLGIYTGAVRAFLLSSAALMAAGGLLVFGLASVVLLIVPFFIKLIVGTNFKNFFPVSIATVVVLALLSDLAARVTDPFTVPSGSLLMIIGIPMIAYIFWSRRSL